MLAIARAVGIVYEADQPGPVDAIVQEIERLRGVEVDRLRPGWFFTWYRTSARLPEHGTSVLGYLRGHFGVYYYHGECWYDSHNSLIDDPEEGNPTHWMLLPKKPGK